MRSNKSFILSVPAVSAAILILAAVLQAAEPERCSKCGMDLAKYPHTRYTVKTSDGKIHGSCGVQCGLSMHVNFGDRWASATATDLITNRPVEAKDAFYVHASSAITDMAPGFIAFKAKSDAEKFATGFGGRVMTYDEALSLWKDRLKKPK